MENEKKNGRRVLLGTAVLLCLLCVSTIGIVKKAFATSEETLCRIGADCAYHGNGYWVTGTCVEGRTFHMDEGYYTGNSDCACTDWVGVANDTWACYNTIS